MSFDSTPINSQSNANNFGGAQGVSAGGSNVFTTNYSPAMNGAMGADGMDSGAGSADSSMTPNAPIKRKSKLPFKMIVSVIFLFMLVVGGGAGYYLTQVNQDVRNQAAGGTYGAGANCSQDSDCSSNLICRFEAGKNPDQKTCLPANDCVQGTTQCTSGGIIQRCNVVAGTLRWANTEKKCCTSDGCPVIKKFK